MEVNESDPSQLDAEYMAFESLLDEPGTSHDDGIPFPEDYDFMSYEELLDVPLPSQEESRVLKLRKLEAPRRQMIRSTMNMKPKFSCDILLYCIRGGKSPDPWGKSLDISKTCFSTILDEKTPFQRF